MKNKVEHQVWLPQVHISLGQQLERLPSGATYARLPNGSLINMNKFITKMRKKGVKNALQKAKAPDAHTKGQGSGGSNP